MRRSPVGRPSNTRKAVLQFIAAGLVTLVIVAALGTLISGAVARKDAVHDARLVNATLSDALIIPHLSDALVNGQADALARMDAAVTGRAAGPTLVRIKLWTPGGRIVYSDEPRLIGATYRLPDREAAALRDGYVDAKISDLSKPENRFERGHGKLLEVYRPVRTPSGQPLLFETYFSYRMVTERERRIWFDYAFVIIGTLILLQLVQIPLAGRMARRLDVIQRERERLMREALTASDATRRRIAGDLHDGVVQDLLAVSYALTGSAARTIRHDDSEVLRRAAETVRGSIRALRSLLVEVYPPSLRAAGLPAALATLASSASDRGLNVAISAPPEVSASSEAEELVFRTAQEALRNIMSHADAHRVEFVLESRAGLLVLSVTDDGVGFDPDVVFDRTTPGHLGLRLLWDLATDAAASLEIDSAPGRGTRVRLEVSAS